MELHEPQPLHHRWFSYISVKFAELQIARRCATFTKEMKRYLGIVLLFLFSTSCKGQTTSETERIVGGPCEDCEATLDYKKLGVAPKPIDTLPKFKENEPKIKITGTVLKKDGKTPAENVLVYVYHVK